MLDQPTSYHDFKEISAIVWLWQLRIFEVSQSKLNFIRKIKSKSSFQVKMFFILGSQLIIAKAKKFQNWSKHCST